MGKTAEATDHFPFWKEGALWKANHSMKVDAFWPQIQTLLKHLGKNMSLELQSYVKCFNAENSVLLIPVASVFDSY